MIQPDEDWFDADIASMELSYSEKAGLQIYRNYTQSFESYAIQRFIEAINLEQLDLSDFQRLSSLIVQEEARFLPVIVCAFADDLLKETFIAVLPSSIPGGKKGMFGSYGPLSDLSKRIKLAYAFDVLSPDLMDDLDRLRSARNAVAHSWNIKDLEDFLSEGHLADLHPIEELLVERQELAAKLPNNLTALAAFRIRLVWIVGRLVYEAAAYNRAKDARLRPTQALYGKKAPKWLIDVSRVALEATLEIAKRN
jgi:hypothetical protein